MYDVLRADRCISGWSMEARVPFGDLDFVEYVMSVDPAWKGNRSGKGKYLLRRAFQSDALLPDEILWREKAAFSDAVGHSMVDDLKEYARAQYSDLAFTRAAPNTSTARPSPGRARSIGTCSSGTTRPGPDDQGLLDAKSGLGGLQRG